MPPSPTPPDTLEVFTTRAVAHSVEKIEDDRLEILRGDLREHLEEFCRDDLSQFGECRLQTIIRTGRDLWRRCDCNARRPDHDRGRNRLSRPKTYIVGADCKARALWANHLRRVACQSHL